MPSLDTLESDRNTLPYGARSIEACIFNERVADNGSPNLQGYGSTQRSFKMQTSINAFRSLLTESQAVVTHR